VASGVQFYISSFIKIGSVVLPLWVVENRPSPLLWPLAYTTSLYYRTSRDMSTKFGLLIDFDLLKAVTSTNTKPEVVLSRHLREMDMTSYFSSGCSDLHEFGSLMQNDMQITAKWSISKPEVEFQYEGRLFFKNGSSYISAVN